MATEAGDCIELEGINTDEWALVFNQYDRNQDGCISYAEFKSIIASRAYTRNIPEHVVREIFRLADADQDEELNLKEFKHMVLNPQNEYILGHIRYRARQYMRILLPPTHHRKLGPGPYRGAYEGEYSCWPPRVTMLFLSIIIVLFFVSDEMIARGSEANGPVALHLAYDPRRRKEAYRYITYMFVHMDRPHLIINVLVQIMLGIPLEMVHGGLRVTAVYIAGVIAGSLGHSCFKPISKLVGASGGVYSLIAAHLATIIMNWREMTYPLIQLFVFILLIATDVGSALNNYYMLSLTDIISYETHFFGAVAGLLVSTIILRNIVIKKHEKIVQWIAIGVYSSLMIAAIVYNIFGNFPRQKV